MRTDNRFLNTFRQLGDAEADALVDKLFLQKRQGELYTLLQQSEAFLSATNSSPIATFILSRKKNPEWYNKERILRGQQVFGEYASEIMMLLGAMALPYCYAASPGNKALYLSDKMRQSPGKRLLDTAKFLIGVSSPGALTTNNSGHIHINKTRLIHAIARYHVKRGAWDMTWGEPINQEDMAGTNLAFSVVILLGLQQSGFVLSPQQKDDFIYLWRYVGYQLAIDETLLPESYLEGYRLAQVIKRRNFKKSLEGVELTKALLNYYKSVVPKDQALLIESQINYLVGSQVGGYLGLKRNTFADRMTSFLSASKEVKNFLLPHQSTFEAMLRQHRLLQDTVTLTIGRSK